MGIPLVRNNSVDDINTSIIAIKKELGKGGSGDMGDVNVNVDVKYEVTDTVEDGNSLPVTSQGVYDYVEGQGFTPVDEVEKNNMKAVTSNAVAKSLSYSTTEQKTGGKVVINGVEKDVYRRFFYTDTQVSTSVIVNFASWNVDKFIKVDAITVGSRYIQCAYFANASDVFRVLIDKQTQNITWECSSPCGYSIILEYTKNE